jgi:hypothetical protein
MKHDVQKNGQTMITEQQIADIQNKWRDEAMQRQEYLNQIFREQWRKDMSTTTTRYRNSLNIERDQINKDHIYNKDNGRYFTVRSSDGSTLYDVDLGDNEHAQGSCTCDDFQYRVGNEGKMCKHLYAVIREYGPYVAPAPEPTPEPELLTTFNADNYNAEWEDARKYLEDYLKGVLIHGSNPFEDAQEDMMVPEEDTARQFLFDVPLPINANALSGFFDAARSLVRYDQQVFVDAGTVTVNLGTPQETTAPALVFYAVDSDEGGY